MYSYNKELTTQKSKIYDLSNKSNFITSNILRSIKSTNLNLFKIENQLKNFMNNRNKLLIDKKRIEKEINEIKLINKDLIQKFKTFTIQKVKPKSISSKIQTAIPIKQEKALEFLTETELKILNFLNEGEKPNNNIQKFINLSREHVARLMKKLYIQGYVERVKKGKAYYYNIKKEMKTILNFQNY
jgi:predicted transcriptional regulator